MAAILPAAVGANGAAFTTFDATVLGCLDSRNGVNCNHYDDKSSVYMNGGPTESGLSDGTYFFAVLTPGNQHGGYVEGAEGNLSDAYEGGTAGDRGYGDHVSDRAFEISDGEIVSSGWRHALGTSVNGRTLMQVGPFDNTDNQGGVYILAICEAGATSSSQCKFDAFHAPADDGEPPIENG